MLCVGLPACLSKRRRLGRPKKTTKLAKMAKDTRTPAVPGLAVAGRRRRGRPRKVWNVVQVQLIINNDNNNNNNNNNNDDL